MESSNFQFILYGDKSTKKQLTVNEPPAYRSTYVSGAQINDAGHLILSFSDGSTADSGYVRGDTGAQGPQGSSLKWCDEWTSTASYSYLDCVTYGGNVYIYISNTSSIATPVTDTTKWEVMLRRGEAGADGADGVTFTPSVSSDGVLSWTNNGNLANPASVNIKGQPGNGFKILGYYSTVSALTSSVASPSVGDAYGVGASEPYDIYIFDGVTGKWINNGQLQGAQGKPGENYILTAADKQEIASEAAGLLDLSGKQDKIMASGILQGDGTGNVSTAETKQAEAIQIPTGILKGTTEGGIEAATPGTDYLVKAPVTSVNGETGTVTVREVPAVTASDNGKFLRVSNGAWAAVTITNANGGSF